MSGPCAAESREQVLTTARQLADAGVSVFRAGVWKPRTEPGSFEGVGEEALSWLEEAQAETGIPAATEVATPEHVTLALKHHIRYLWLGARTTTNPFLVQQLADTIKSFPGLTLLVKNPISPDVRLWKGAIERLQQAGVERVIAVHRGFQTGQPSPYRNAPVWSVPFELKLQMPDIPLLLDPSHIAGKAELVPALAEQAMTLGYDGLMIEAHCCPAEAQTDAEQQLTPAQLRTLLTHLPQRENSPQHGSADRSELCGDKNSKLSTALPIVRQERTLNSPHGVIVPLVGKELTSLRQQLDETDDTLFLLLLQRMQISRRIGAFKREHNMPVLQEKRYAEVLNRRLEWARQNGLDEEVVRRIMDAIHEESCRWQL